jgi:hypothetical protein
MRATLHPAHVFGVVRIAGEPLRQTIGLRHVQQKDFIERCAIILALHNLSPTPAAGQTNDLSLPAALLTRFH